MTQQANAAMRTIVAQMDQCIDEHGRAKKRLDDCELPAGNAVCGVPAAVAHVHHSALCTLVSGQRILLQERRDRLDMALAGDDDDAQDDLMVDRKRGVLRANGPVAMMLAIVAAAGAVALAAHEMFSR